MIRDQLQVTYNVPHHYLAEVQQHVSNSIIYLPAWITRLRVIYLAAPADGETAALAEMDTNYRYRSACLTLFEAFFIREEDEKKHTMIHEMCHVVAAPLVEMLSTMITAMKDHSFGASSAFSRFKHLQMESVVEDMTQVITDLQNVHRGIQDVLNEKVDRLEREISMYERKHGPLNMGDRSVLSTHDKLSSPCDNGEANQLPAT